MSVYCPIRVNYTANSASSTHTMPPSNGKFEAPHQDELLRIISLIHRVEMEVVVPSEQIAYVSGYTNVVAIKLQ